jgi:hypothetical protein
VTITVDDSGQTATSDTGGNFALADVVTGGHSSITADAPGYLLAVCTAPTITAPETPLAMLTLLSGDINDDNRVDILDLSAVANSFGQPASGLPVDVNGDSVVNILDLSLIAANYGQGAQLWSCLP